MAIYTDPRTGQERNLGQDDATRQTTALSWLGMTVLIVAIALGGWYFYRSMVPTVDRTNTGNPTTTEPVTTPSSPNASPTHPAPSPNPGP